MPTSDVDLVVLDTRTDVQMGLKALASLLSRKGIAKAVQVRGREGRGRGRGEGCKGSTGVRARGEGGRGGGLRQYKQVLRQYKLKLSEGAFCDWA